jgi:hypothetical protein
MIKIVDCASLKKTMKELINLSFYITFMNLLISDNEDDTAKRLKVLYGNFFVK